MIMGEFMGLRIMVVSYIHIEMISIIIHIYIITVLDGYK